MDYYFYGVEIASATTTDGTYKLASVVPGDYVLVISKIGHNTQYITVNVGSVDIKQDVIIWLVGDVNHDGYVDGADAMLLRQFVARWKLETFYPENADIDNSGVIDGADAMLLRQIIAG